MYFLKKEKWPQNIFYHCRTQLKYKMKNLIPFHYSQLNDKGWNLIPFLFSTKHIKKEIKFYSQHPCIIPWFYSIPFLFFILLHCYLHKWGYFSKISRTSWHLFSPIAIWKFCARVIGEPKSKPECWLID